MVNALHASYVLEGPLMTLRAHRLVAAGALAVAAVAAPIAVAFSSVDSTDTARPACLSWYGNKEDGVCLSYSNGNGLNVGTPIYDGGTGPNAGWRTGPLLPGQTINIPLG